MDMTVTMIMISLILSGVSGATIAMGNEDDKKYGVVAATVAFIIGAITPIFDYVLVTGLIIWFVSLGLTTIFQDTETTKRKGKVGVEMPGAKYPLGGFKKPTIKNMVKM